MGNPKDIPTFGVNNPLPRAQEDARSCVAANVMNSVWLDHNEYVKEAILRKEFGDPIGRYGVDESVMLPGLLAHGVADAAVRGVFSADDVAAVVETGPVLMTTKPGPNGITTHNFIVTGVVPNGENGYFYSVLDPGGAEYYAAETIHSVSMDQKTFEAYFDPNSSIVIQLWQWLPQTWREP